MGIITVKNKDNTDVEFTRLGGDNSKSRFVGLTLGGAALSVTLEFEQKPSPIGSSASSRTIVRSARDWIGMDAKAHRSSVSILLTRAAGDSDEDISNLISYALNAMTTQKADLMAKVVP